MKTNNYHTMIVNNDGKTYSVVLLFSLEDGFLTIKVVSINRVSILGYPYS